MTSNPSIEATSAVTIEAMIVDVCATASKLDGLIAWIPEKSCFSMRPYYPHASSFDDSRPREILVTVTNARGRKIIKKVTYVIGTYIPKATIEATTEPMRQLNIDTSSGPIIHGMTL